jgi:hypothetical protein
MKKTLFLFLALALALGTNSCKKQSCPKPVEHAAGTWKVVSVTYKNGSEITNNAEKSCLMDDQLVLSEDHKGTSWTWKYFLENNGQCGELDLNVTNWVEDFDQKVLYITTSDGDDEYYDKFEFVDENTLRQTRLAGLNDQGNDYIYCTFTYKKQ